MTNPIMVEAIVLIALSFIWPIEAKKDVLVRAIFFLAGGMLWMFS